MIASLYVPRSSPIHALPPGLKVVALMAAGTAVFLIPDPLPVAGALAVVAGLYALARIPARVALAQIRPVLLVLAVIFAAQALLDHWTTGLLVVLRFATLIALAALVTLTTRASAMIEALERGLAPLRHLGLDPAKIGLALSMALRFIPVIAGITREVREAQRARGLDRSIVAVAVPVLLRTLKMADDIAQAMEARGYGGPTGPAAVAAEEARRARGEAP
ncbi:MAG: energy-coupling factor transporter transmembrane protein EcfT [Azospirillaceae bacterium]